MRVVVGCEYSGRVRNAFLARGHKAVSVDLLPSETPGPHVVGDVLEYLERERERGNPIDLFIAHPPCTHLASSGARWLTDHFVKSKTGPETWRDANGKTWRGYWHDGSEKRRLQKEAVEFVRALWAVHSNKVALENPVSMLSSLWFPPTQTIQPWEHGHGETKATCLWLRGLPPITPSKIVEGRSNRIHMMAPGPNRWKDRSRTYEGIAEAFAAQWG
jgi:site-specific DNA-cytosine methylase